jgi:4-amino-4-deoxy-L-arabinose transferase-like glycosyltransferase
MKLRMPRVIGWVLALVTVITVTINQRDIGIARDEVIYMSSGTHYADWWLGLVTFQHGVGGDRIKRTFEENHEHPPLIKTLSGLSHRVLHDKLGIAGELTAFRFPAAVLHGVLVLLVFTMVFELWGLAEAIIAALCLLLLPRALFHAGLTCFDAPIMTLWFATVYAYWRAIANHRRWPWQVGVIFGLALATKHNAFLLPFAFGLHYAVVAWRAGRWRGLVTFRPRVIISLAVLGPLTLIVLWPWLWLDPIGHIHEWIKFHTTHVHYNYEYLGHNWNAPRFPWHTALVTTLFTVPVATLVAAALGAGVWIARWRRKTAVFEHAPVLLLALSAAASIGPFFLGSTPIFGAEKHWMPALPTLCIAAGVGAVWAARRAAIYLVQLRPIGEQLAHRIALGLVASTLVLAAASETVTAQPYALTWYNALAGGAPGGADLGMNRQFWGVAARGVLPLIAQQPAGRVYSHDASPAWGWYQKLGLLPPGYPDAGWETSGIAQSQLAIVIHEKHFNRHDYLVWKSYGTVQPIYVLRSDGVPIVTVYRRPTVAPSSK